LAAKCSITRLESFEQLRDAIEREQQIKAWTRAKQIALIESTIPAGMISPEIGISRRHYRFFPKIA